MMKLTWPLAAVYMAACEGRAPMTAVGDGGVRGTLTDNTGAAVANAAVAASVKEAGGAQASVSPLVLSRTMPDSCALARPDFGGPATAADRALFAYDASAPSTNPFSVSSGSSQVASTLALGVPTAFTTVTAGSNAYTVQSGTNTAISGSAGTLNLQPGSVNTIAIAPAATASTFQLINVPRC